MPRSVRVKGDSGIYHVVLRGINQQTIFEDDEDNEKFLGVLTACKKASGFELYAYCLMGNHVHLLIRTISEGLDTIFKRIGAKYVFWYNWKYQRVGHLFQDRFRSEPVETDKYFLTVLRYIHQNPVKAGICDTVDSYIWSSYGEYFGENRIVDREFVLDMTGLDGFIKLNQDEVEEVCIDNDSKRLRLTDAAAKKIMKKICGSDTVEGFQHIDAMQRIQYIKKLKEHRISIRQITRITGASRSIVERA